MAFLGQDIKKLGFGLMRLPMAGEGVVDLAQTEKMTDMFLERGFTYFDTAYGYLGGESEIATGKALVARHPRESFQLATKLPAWAGVKTAEEAKKMFHTSLERTGAEYFDYYLLHNLGATRTAAFDKFGMWDYLSELKEKGLVKNIGFSFHDTAEILDEVLTKHPEVDFVQLQINYADWESGAVQSRLCYETAWNKHKKPIVIMEPVKGGILANPVESVRKIFDAHDPKPSYSSWAIRFAAGLPGVITVLSGMSNLEQMEDNTSYMQNFTPLSDGEQEVIKEVRQALDSMPSVPCTSCLYCTPECPQNIVIPQIFDSMNRLYVFEDMGAAQYGYNWETKFGGKGSDCIECGACEVVCPQKIDIIDRLKTAVELFE